MKTSQNFSGSTAATPPEAGSNCIGFRNVAAYNAADEKLTQLRSLLMGCYGVGCEWLENLGAEHRDNILWIASDLAEDVGRLMEGGAA